jgi:hypothetical protein
VVGEVFFAALMVLLSQPTPTRAQTIAAVPFLVLWANCHASFLGGFGFIGLCLAARILDRARLGLTFRDFLCRDLRTRRLAEIWVLGFVAVGFLNPHGWTLFDKILTVDGHYNMIFLEEWQPLRMERGFGWHGIFLASMLAVVGTHLLSPSGFSNGDMLLLFAFACAGCMQQHMLVWWAMVLPWVLAPHWTAIIGANKSTSESNPVRVGMGAKIAMGVALGAFVAASPIVAWFASGRPVPPSQSLDAATPWALGIQLQTEPNPEPTAFPELHRILAENYPGGRFRGTIVATPKRADFLVWAGLRTTFCSQLYLFTSKYWTDQELLLQCHPGWWETFDMLEVNMIVLGPDEYPELRRHILADAGWQTLQRPGPLLDPQFGSFDSWIFARKKPVVE